MVTRRTNKGQVIDLDKIMASQKETIAAGNMKVNGNGDVLGANGQIIQKNEERVRAYYRDHPNSSTSRTSVRGSSVEEKPPLDHGPKPKTSKTLEENERVRKLNEPISGKDLAKGTGGYKERILDNGDIEVISYTDDPVADEFTEQDKIVNEVKPKRKKVKPDSDDNPG